MRAFASVYIFSIILMTAVMGWILTKGNRSRQTFSCILCQLLLNIWSEFQNPAFSQLGTAFSA